MPLNGTGTFAPIEPEFPAIPETTILASEFNTIITDISEALSLSIYKDGQAIVLANIDWGDNKIVNLAAGSNDKDAVNFDQVFHNPTFVGSLDDGVILAGTKTTINSTLLEINSDTVEIDSANIGIHASDNLLLDSDAILNIESPSITLDALNDINLLSALTTINSPNIVLTGNTLATLNTNTTAITQPLADSSTKLATTEYVTNKAFSATLPGQAGNTGALLSTNGITGYWTKTISGITINQVDNDFTLQDNIDSTKKARLDCSAITPGQIRSLILPDASTTLVGTDTFQTITNKTMTIRDSAFQIYDNVDTTKRVMFECASIGAGQTRIITMPDADVTLGDSPIKLLQTFTSPGGSEWEVLPTIIDNTYDIYEFVFHSLTGTGNPYLGMQWKAGGAYITANYWTYATTGVYSYGFLSKNMPTTANSCFAGTIRFYTPWSTAFKKYCYASITHSMDVSSGTGLESTDGKISNTSLSALQGFKFACFSTAGTIGAGAIGKWYGIK